MHSISSSAISDLQGLKIAALKDEYRRLFAEEPRSSNKQFLFRRIAWKLQALREGDLSERARLRVSEIADDSDLRVRAPRSFSPLAGHTLTCPSSGPPRDYRLPAPGTLVTRRYGTREIIVKILDKGFEFESKHYDSLSAIAREVTGTRWNGFLFFGLTGRRNA